MNTERPALSGNARVGQTLTGTQGVWSGAEPITYAFQWRRCDTAGDNCSDIASATGLTYTLGVEDIGARTFIRVTATNADGSAAIRSWLSAIVVSAPVNTLRPALSGTAKVAETLTVSTGTWIGTAPMTYAYQWRRCDADGSNCSDIGDATEPAYVLALADAGNRVQGRVTATNGYGSAVQRSWNSAVVLGAGGGGDSSRVGLHASAATLGYESGADFQLDMDIIDGSGAGWVRIDINWAVIQRHGPTSYDWAPFDRIVTDARARGLNVLGILAYTPSWARPPGGTSSTPPEDVADFATFADAATKHYSAMGVHAYEVWNEPNITSFWKPAPDPQQYVALLKAAYPAIRGADPSATVISGGLSPATSSEGNIDPRTFLEAMYANGAKGYFDALGHHPYCFPAAPGDAESWSAWYQMYGTSTSLRGTMVANGDGGKKIWATEFGYPTNGPAGTYVSEATQAQHIAKAYELYSSYSWAGPLFTYASRDKGTDPSSRYNFYGLSRFDFSTKPALAAVQAAAGAE